MGIVIDHEARRNAIISKSIQLFAEHGYDGVTYQKIADSCGIARTTLYKYFRNKRLIFNYAIGEASRISNQKFRQILNPADTAFTRLDRLMHAVLTLLFERNVMMTVILDYLLAAQRSGTNVERNIRRHTVTFKLILHRLILEGIRNGEFKRMDTRFAVELLYAQLEATILRLTVSQNADFDDLAEHIRQVLRLLQRRDGEGRFTSS
ncbi:MAG: TetR/AcrR family transcriptional regulator [Kiritimatiellaeota bacterium]|nr:TetR/AcrR family transcriptional regulator [Kiritimatiellota bacterium]